jgi:uncharacterized protein
MESVTYESVEVDRCTGCKGIWFDMLEQQALQAVAGSEAIDVGDPGVGRKFNEVGRINCPVCKGPMIRMVDHDQPHLWFESCPVCYGVFFDAGEFKDYKERTILDRFRDLLAQERR